MTMDNIRKIINTWDPIGLFPMAPKDEYAGEIKKIYDIICSNHEQDIQLLANAINDMFIKSFGEDVYHSDMEKCMQIAESLVHSRNIV